MQVAWLNERYSHFRSLDTYLWVWLVKTGISRQQNRNDCGIFTMAFAKHCVHRRSINFTQENIPYFHSKIVIEIFKMSWQLNANILGLTDLSDFPWWIWWWFPTKSAAQDAVLFFFFFFCWMVHMGLLFCWKLQHLVWYGVSSVYQVERIDILTYFAIVPYELYLYIESFC